MFIVSELDEQQRIADCLSAVDAQIAAETEKLAALKTHKLGLMQQLFPAPGLADQNLAVAQSFCRERTRLTLRTIGGDEVRQKDLTTERLRRDMTDNGAMNADDLMLEEIAASERRGESLA